jgi:hypothetical protein
MTSDFDFASLRLCVKSCLVRDCRVITLRETLAHERYQTQLDEGRDFGDL